MEMLGRRPCGSGAVAEGKQGMMTAEINQAHQLTSPLQDLLPQLLPPFSSLSELATYQMEQMIKCYSSLFSNRKPPASSPAGISRLQPPLNTPKMEPAGDHFFPHELKSRNNSDLMEEQRDDYRPNDHKKRRKIKESISVVTAVPYDAQLWRKYGQKSIRGAKQPRSYFKCGYWKERGCQAKKTVQQDDKDETKYHVVYTNAHTCSVAIQLQSFPNYLPIECPPEILNSNNRGKCFGSSSVDIPGEHQICPPSANQATPATGDEKLMPNNTMLSSQVASQVLTRGTLEMTNNDEMLGFLPTLESFEFDNDYLTTMIDELYKSGIYI